MTSRLFRTKHDQRRRRATHSRSTAPRIGKWRFEQLEDRRMLTAEYESVYSFAGQPDGNTPYADLTLVGSTLYGTTQLGGSDNDGTIFSINPSNGAETVLYSFGAGGSADGAYPVADLTLVGSTLYGTTEFGGADNDGTIFSINTDNNPNNTGYQTLVSFGADGSSDGAEPAAGLTLVGSTLYGTTGAGGSDGDGTIFSINTDNNPSDTGYQTLVSFGAGGSTDGVDPAADLTLAGSTLYGTTSYGGADDDGTIFSINTNNELIDTNYQTVYSFGAGGSNDGENPEAGLTLVGSTLYGTTNWGGAEGDGTVFSLDADNNPNDTGDQTVYSFGDGGSADGAFPSAGLTLVGSTLYGTTEYGGADDGGTIFSINTDDNPNNTGYQTAYSFGAGGSTDGENPSAGLTLVGSTLYGTTTGGGADVDGTVFSISNSALNVTNATTTENTQTTSGLVITPNAADVGVANSFQITNITGGALYLTDGVTPVTDSEFLTVAQGEAGLKFTPTANSLVAGSFTAQASVDGTVAGLFGATVVATVTVTTPPSSSVAALPARTSLTSIPISWSGTSGSAGIPIASYTIYESTNGGPYAAWLTDTTQTSATFTGVDGDSYAFYSQAMDTAGDVEPAHATADAQVTVTAYPWHNSANPYDVLGTGGSLTPQDVLVEISYYNANGGGPLPASAALGSYYVDVMGNNYLTPLDALQEIVAVDAVFAADAMPHADASLPAAAAGISTPAASVASEIGGAAVAIPATAVVASTAGTPTVAAAAAPPAALLIPASASGVASTTAFNSSPSSLSSASAALAAGSAGSTNASIALKPYAAAASTGATAASAGRATSAKNAAVDRALADADFDWSDV